MTNHGNSIQDNQTERQSSISLSEADFRFIYKNLMDYREYLECIYFDNEHKFTRQAGKEIEDDIVLLGQITARFDTQFKRHNLDFEGDYRREGDKRREELSQENRAQVYVLSYLDDDIPF